MIQINEVCSFGSLCHSASFLKRNDLKKVSYPFDWIFSNMNIIKDCLNNNFSVFMNKEYFIEKTEKYKCGHKKYHPDMFNHCNPINDEDYHYYERCIVRFNQFLQSDNNKLFLMMFVNQNPNTFLEKDHDFHKKIIDFTNDITKYTKNENYLFVVHFGKQNEQKYEFKQMNDNCHHSLLLKEQNDNGYPCSSRKTVHLLYIYLKSNSNGNQFLDSSDEEYFKSIFFKYYSFTK